MTAAVASKVLKFCQDYALLANGDHILVGVSGGPDSLCLLHLLANLRAELDLTLTVGHLNHQLRAGDAQADEVFVRAFAAQWQVPVRVESRPVAKLAAQRKQSIEEAARQIRYAFLWRTARDVGAHKIAVGHNADDQVETILMHFLRGSGLAGLRGMLPQLDISSLRLNPDDLLDLSGSAAPKLIRPLLEISRQDIDVYCDSHGLSPRQDDSNQDITFFRNRLRHELIPYLESYNPNIRQVLRNMSKVITADVEILKRELSHTWPTVVIRESTEQVDFDLQLWSDLPRALKRATLRQAVQRLRRHLRDINFAHIETAIAVVDQGVTGSQATLPGGLILTKSYDTFSIKSKSSPRSSLQANWPQLFDNQLLPLSFPGITPIPGTDWQLTATLHPQKGMGPGKFNQTGRWEAYLDAAVVGNRPALRPRRPGDVFQPLGMPDQRKKVNEFMIDQKIPADQRDQIPLLVAGQQILWICGYRPDERARIRRTTQQIAHFKFERRQSWSQNR
jgi:tRNA(Ile)-lysidine synthase